MPKKSKAKPKVRKLPKEGTRQVKKRNPNPKPSLEEELRRKPRTKKRK